MQAQSQPFWKSSAFHVALGFLLMGSWAFFANSQYGSAAALKAGLVQGALTAFITLFMKKVIEAVVARTKGVWGYILPPLAAFAISVSLLSLFHGLAQTPAIVLTISVPITVSTIYATLYTILLRRAS